MAKVLYFDPFSGISGDMTLGALVHAGLPLGFLQKQLALLPISGFRVEAHPTAQNGIGGIKIEVVIEQPGHDHRPYHEIVQLINASSLELQVKTQALKIFGILAQAEAKIHGVESADVEFHEVGAVDSIIDIVGACIGFAYFGFEEFYCGPLPLGRGFIQTQHGLLPVPAPATLEMLTQAGANILPATTLKGGVEYPGNGELVTPTGAAIVAALCQFQRPSIKLTGSGYGYGSKKLPWPNALRIWLGESAQPAQPTEHFQLQTQKALPHSHSHNYSLSDQLISENSPQFTASILTTNGLEMGEIDLIETNLDDMLPEALGYLMEKLLAAGALDVFFTPIQMKKNRPAIMLSVMAQPPTTAQLAALIIRESSSFGVRVSKHQRYMAGREIRTIETPYGPVQVKLKIIDGHIQEVVPEYESVAALARQTGLPWRQIYDDIRRLLA